MAASASNEAAGATSISTFMEGAFGFDDAVPAETRAGFGEGSEPAGRFAAISARFQGGDGVAVKNEAQNNVENHGGEREGCAPLPRGPFDLAPISFGDQAAEHREENSGEENSQNQRSRWGSQSRAKRPRGEGPEKFDTSALGRRPLVDGGRGGECGEEDGKRRSLFFLWSALAQKKWERD